MMQSLLEVNTRVKIREFFRRPQRSETVPLNWLDRDSKTASHKANAQLHRKVSDASQKTLRSPLEGFHQTRALASVRYPISGSNLVEAIRYTLPPDFENGQVWINQTQYFEGVSPAVWNYSLSGRQICQKWLQERQGYTLCQQSIDHYQQIVMILKEVIDLMTGIDGIFLDKRFKTHSQTN
jgi:hypothetical protein